MSYITKKLESLGLKKKKKKAGKGEGERDLSGGEDGASLTGSGDTSNDGDGGPGSSGSSPTRNLDSASPHLSPSPPARSGSPPTSAPSGTGPNAHPDTLGLLDFDLGRTLGTGSFGRVHIVRLRRTGEYFAMKVMKKSRIVELRQVEHTVNERAILSALSHPFVVELLCTFQDAHNLYFVMEFVVGGEIFSILRRAKTFPNDIGKFYAAEVILAFEHLHAHDIVYRDLKPENLLIHRDGHLKLTDFGFAKQLSATEGGLTRTLCGTPEYLAPEIIRSRDYGKPVDWYALGVLIYEMLVGYPPFYHENHMKLYEAVLAGHVHYPTHLDPNAVDLISRLLMADTSERYGCLHAGVQDIKGHPWFSGVNWDRLLHKQIRPPYMPKVSEPGDARHFELYPEEKIAYVDLPLVPDPYAHLFKDF